MSYIPYIPGVKTSKVIPSAQSMSDVLSTQNGKGCAGSIQVVSPQKSVIQRAKARLKRQINSSKPKGRLQSSSGVKKRKTTTKKKTTKTKVSNTKKKTAKKAAIKRKSPKKK